MKRKIKKYKHKCIKCGGIFYSRKKNTKFCSDKCRAIKLQHILNTYVNGKPYNYNWTREHFCKICGKKLSHGTKTGYCINHYNNKEHCKKISNSLINLCNGGYRKGSGRGKHGWYKGYWCDSSWELAFVIYNLEHDIKFKRNTKKFKYVFEKKEYNYIPDFKYNNNKYVEIKGYSTEQSKAKIEQFPHKLQLLDEKNIKPYLDYTIHKYKKDFINLYENTLS